MLNYGIKIIIIVYSLFLSTCQKNVNREKVKVQYMLTLRCITTTKEQVSSRPSWPSTMVVWTLKIVIYNDKSKISGTQVDDMKLNEVRFLL